MSAFSIRRPSPIIPLPRASAQPDKPRTMPVRDAPGLASAVPIRSASATTPPSEKPHRGGDVV
jgi:hypothetical protein